MLTEIDLLIPIVIGVTGHRYLPPQDELSLRLAIEQTLARFELACPNSPLVLITGMAEGADRLAARCAFERGPRWQVGAVLALAPEEFEKDFETIESKQEFRDLLDRCTWVRPPPNENTDRPAVYCEVGLWISHHAQWLIALWDGQETNAAPGGTAWVVEVFRQRHKGHEISLPDAGHVAHIMVQRSALI
jgi:hypothetical protein